MNDKQSEAFIEFKIIDVDSIPCDLKEQSLIFDNDEKILSDPIKTPWPMPWVMEEITKLSKKAKELSNNERVKIYNPEESDQYLILQIKKN